jgi:hypothetical protein
MTAIDINIYTDANMNKMGPTTIFRDFFSPSQFFSPNNKKYTVILIA